MLTWKGTQLKGPQPQTKTIGNDEELRASRNRNDNNKNKDEIINFILFYLIF